MSHGKSTPDRHTCGFSAAPSFGLFPEKMLEYGVRPFAIGQAKVIMAYFVLGWILTAIGFINQSLLNINGWTDRSLKA